MSGGEIEERTGGGSHNHHYQGHRWPTNRGETLAPTRMLMVENKIFYLDVLKSDRLVIKILEVSKEKRFNHILMAMPTLAKFIPYLESMIEVYSTCHPMESGGGGPVCRDICSETIHMDERKYHIDLKENACGRFLRVSEIVEQRTSRFQIAIPADGMGELHTMLTEILTTHGEAQSDGEEEESSIPPVSHHHHHSSSSSSSQQPHTNDVKISIENKSFTFDCRQNHQGARYIVISEFRGNLKNTIHVPESGWDSFRETFDDYSRKCQDVGTA